MKRWGWGAALGAAFVVFLSARAEAQDAWVARNYNPLIDFSAVAITGDSEFWAAGRYRSSGEYFLVRYQDGTFGDEITVGAVGAFVREGGELYVLTSTGAGPEEVPTVLRNDGSTWVAADAFWGEFPSAVGANAAVFSRVQLWDGKLYVGMRWGGGTAFFERTGPGAYVDLCTTGFFAISDAGQLYDNFGRIYTNTGAECAWLPIPSDTWQWQYMDGSDVALPMGAFSAEYRRTIDGVLHVLGGSAVHTRDPSSATWEMTPFPSTGSSVGFLAGPEGRVILGGASAQASEQVIVDGVVVDTVGDDGGAPPRFAIQATDWDDSGAIVAVGQSGGYLIRERGMVMPTPDFSAAIDAMSPDTLATPMPDARGAFSIALSNRADPIDVLTFALTFSPPVDIADLALDHVDDDRDASCIRDGDGFECTTPVTATGILPNGATDSFELAFDIRDGTMPTGPLTVVANVTGDASGVTTSAMAMTTETLVDIETSAVSSPIVDLEMPADEGVGAFRIDVDNVHTDAVDELEFVLRFDPAVNIVGARLNHVGDEREANCVIGETAGEWVCNTSPLQTELVPASTLAAFEVIVDELADVEYFGSVNLSVEVRAQRQGWRDVSTTTSLAVTDQIADLAVEEVDCEVMLSNHRTCVTRIVNNGPEDLIDVRIALTNADFFDGTGDVAPCIQMSVCTLERLNVGESVQVRVLQDVVGQPFDIVASAPGLDDPAPDNNSIHWEPAPVNNDCSFAPMRSGTPSSGFVILAVAALLWTRRRP